LAAQCDSVALLADKGHDAGCFIGGPEVPDMQVVIRPKSNRKAHRQCDRAL
jgi:hypothetical protein